VKKACVHIITGFARNYILLLIFFSVVGSAHAQKTTTKPDFAKVDSFVLAIKYENDYIKLARDLTNPFPEDMNKVRAIFKWITNNISYDYRFINSGREITIPDCEGRYDCNEIIRSWENDYIKKILRTRRAIADGYAKLFQKLCEISHIQTELIPGYFRTKPYQIGNKISVNHTWNAVFIDTAWYFIDLTRASGYCIENEETDKLVKFVKEYQEYYWLTPFYRLARNHYPKNGFWGEQYHIAAVDFFNKPHYYSTEVLENISEEEPATGILSVKKDDSIHFCFRYNKDIKLIQVNTNNFRNPSLWTTINVSKSKTKLVRDTWAEKKQVYIPFKKTGNTYSFDFPVKDNSLYYLELIFDYKKAIRYKVNVHK
jgi:hypothetical protein